MNEQNTKKRVIDPSKLEEVPVDEIMPHLATLAEKDISVCIITDTHTIKPLQRKELEAFVSENKEKYNYHIQKDWKDKINVIDEKYLKEMAKLSNVLEIKDRFNEMSVAEREELLDQSLELLTSTDDTAEMPINIKTIVNMVDVIANTFYSNNANIEQVMQSDDQKINTSGIILKTGWIVNVLLDMFRNNAEKLSPFIDKISTGSHTFDHINKVFLHFVSFMIFINDYIDNGMISKRIRRAFKENYHSFYERRFPEKILSVEAVYQNGLAKIDEEKTMQEYAVGALLHDIGKITDIDYHDGKGEYDVKLTRKHALLSYNMLVKIKEYPFSILAMAALHHEYNGETGSYSFTDGLLTKVSKKKVVIDDANYFVTGNTKEFLHGAAFGFLPCKILEIIDIYDALVGKRKLPVPDALKLMKIEFIRKSTKIDPILFRIFLEYQLKNETIGQPTFEDIDINT